MEKLNSLLTKTKIATRLKRKANRFSIHRKRKELIFLSFYHIKTPFIDVLKENIIEIDVSLVTKTKLEKRGSISNLLYFNRNKTKTNHENRKYALENHTTLQILHYTAIMSHAKRQRSKYACICVI